MPQDSAQRANTNKLALSFIVWGKRESVLASTGVTPDNRKEYDKVLKKVDGFFQVRKNVIYE